MPNLLWHGLQDALEGTKDETHLKVPDGGNNQDTVIEIKKLVPIMDLADWMEDTCFCSPFYLKLYYFAGCLVSLSFKACRLILSRSVDDLFDDSFRCCFAM